MEFRLLGPLEVSDGERRLPLGGPKQRTVLAHLLVRANEVVTVDRLIDGTWGDEPPGTARNTIQAYVHNLRKALGAERIQHRSSGYVLTADASEVDALRFEALVGKAHRAAAADPSGAVEALREALRLWRGPALDDLSEQPALQPEIARLEELRMAALEERIGAELALGDHRALIPELETLIRRHPFREGLWGHLMVALYRGGRQGDALAAYRRAREFLADELGVDPSPELRRLHEQILRQDPGLELTGEPLRGYRLLELLGEGAFGAVHRAFQPEVGREVAVKIIRPEFANHPEFIRRFASEAQLVARLEHPHITPVYDYWREPGGAYLVMRYLRGGSLREALAHGPLEADRVVQVMDQIASALAAAHRQGVVHRDVKPANILFDEEANAYLSDFGIATDLAAAEATEQGRTTSPFASYLSPEEARGEAATPRADIYGLGVVLYEALGGRHPFAETPPDALAAAHAREPFPSIRSVRPDLPPALEEVIGRAAAKDPEARYEDARMLASAVRDALVAGRAQPVTLPPLKARNPYKGLRPFLEADAVDFFGREALTERLLDRMREGGVGSKFLAVVGPSGSGKSSVVRAGLLPALRHGALPGSDRWFVATMHPGSHPLEELEAALTRIAVDPPPGLADRIERDESGLLEAAEEVLPPDASVFLVVIDQFEEAFTLVGEEERRKFLATLLAAVTDPRSRVRVIVTLRADFYDRPLAYRGFGDLLAGRTQAIAPLARDELERVVSGPAEGVGVAVEPRLAAEIVAEVSDQPGGLPLLQYALTELFERRRDATLTLEAHHEIGGVSGALARRAEDLYGRLTQAGKEAARQLFLRLVSPGEERSGDTRERALRAELTTLGVDREALEAVIDTFGTHRLLSFDRDPATRGPTVEVAHETLLSEWDRLARWIDRHRADLRRRHSLAAAAGEWEAHGRDPDYLPTGSRLAEFEEWGRTTTLELTDGERRFLDASLQRRRREQARKVERLERQRRLERRARTRLWALAAAIVLLAGAATYGGLALLGGRPPDTVLVFQGGGDEGFNDMIEAGFDRAVTRLDIEAGKIVPQAVSFDTALRRVAEAGARLIVVAGTEDIGAIAGDFPDTRFIALDSSGDRPNVSYLRFAEHEGSFLVGAAAALKSETGTIGFVGGVDYELIWRFQAGYEAGARAIDPEIQVLSRYLTEPPDFSGFSSPTLGAQAASELFTAGADVIYHAAGWSGVGVFLAAAARSGEEGEHLWGIGVDTDQYRSLPVLQESVGDEGPPLEPHVLTSMVKRVDHAIYTALGDYSRDTFIPGVREFDLAAGGVDIAYSGGFIDDIRPVIEDLRQQIIAGEIDVPALPVDKAGAPAP
ncbi:MAG TPA: BTAD domain-containing putative transcriptional regulator [Actinomycetota bacterium]